MPVLYHLAETCTGSDRGFHTFAVCLPETDIVQQLINVVVKSLFTFLSAPYLNTIFGEPFNDKRCFVGDSPNTVKHKDKQNIELLLTGKILNDLNLISGFGAPPGYVGYEEGGKLTEAVRRRPYCLVLMDELEKAHPDVLGILLQIMEEGTLTDSTGRHVSFKNAIVVMTSNVGGQIRGDGLGFCAGGRSAEIGEALQQAFSPEFLGRIDQTVCFEPLGTGALEAITWKYLRQLQERTATLGTQLLLPPELATELLKKRPGKDGARQIRRLVQTEVEGPLASYLLRCGKKPARVKPKLEDGKLVF